MTSSAVMSRLGIGIVPRMGVFLVDLRIVDRRVRGAFDDGRPGDRSFGGRRRNLAVIAGAFRSLDGRGQS
jgi:hypothetical protein